jgi:ADP-ribose pyrophosphatase YjhB (NUDIX family)
MQEWTVAGAVIERDGDLLLVCNRRRNGSLDWSPPGGVIELGDGEEVLDGLRREVLEETGLRIERWGSLLYSVEATAPGLGWVMQAQVWSAEVDEFEFTIDDPDGIVIDAAFVAAHHCESHLAQSHDWVREPLVDWLAHRWETPRQYRYRLEGETPGAARIVRL